MARIPNDQILAAIDVGTTKICVLIAHHIQNTALDIIGIGKAPSHGLQRGVVVDIAKTVQSIKAAIQEAELMAGISLEKVAIGVSGAHIHSINASGAVPIKHGNITSVDINNVLEAAKAIPIPQGQQILHVLPQYFIIDGNDRVHDPIGMHGIRLEVKAHIILGATASVQNLVSCCQKAGVGVHDIVLEQLASAEAVLSEDERTLGVGVLDIGGGTSDFAVYQQGSIRHTMVLPVAGNHFTNDIAIGLRTTLADAERIKKEYGLVAQTIENPECIEIHQVHGTHKQVITQNDLLRIIGPRADELLQFIYEEIKRFNLQPFMPTGLVITGGGSLLNGLTRRAESICRLPVRLGSLVTNTANIPSALQHPMYATGYGLLMHVCKKRAAQNSALGDGPLVKRVFEHMKSWVIDFF